jgi:SAM-dependent methyltransferase
MKAANRNGMASFDSYSAHYNEIINQATAFSGLNVDFFVRVKAAYMKDILIDYFGDPLRIDLLDIGCGIGSYHPHWVDEVHSLHGVDVSARSIARASERNPRVSYKVYDGEWLPFADNSFDAVVAICVMHHVDPPKRLAFTVELRRMIKPGGIAVIFEHNPWNPLTRRVVSNIVFDEGVILLPHWQTEEFMTQAGFAVRPSRFILTIPPFTKFMRRIDGLYSGIRLGAQYFTCGIAKA